MALQHKARLSVMTEEKDAFLSKLKESRMSVYKVSEFCVASSLNMTESQIVLLIALQICRRNEALFTKAWLNTGEAGGLREEDG